MKQGETAKQDQKTKRTKSKTKKTKTRKKKKLKSNHNDSAKDNYIELDATSEDEEDGDVLMNDKSHHNSKRDKQRKRGANQMDGNIESTRPKKRRKLKSNKNRPSSNSKQEDDEDNDQNEKENEEDDEETNDDTESSPGTHISKNFPYASSATTWSPVSHKSDDDLDLSDLDQLFS